jgi:radical SAM protein with 4Fe4S-binding SPASM domain
VGIQLHLATVNTCNARCHFCVYKSPENTLPKGVMDMDLFRKIIDDAASIPQIDSIAFSALGEPLLDRHLVERVAYARKARPDWSPFEVYTNGVNLTPEKFDALREAGIDSLSVSLNATSPAQHEEVMGLKGKYGTVVSHARYACDNHQGKVDVIVKAVRDDDKFDLHDQIKFYMTWGMRLRPDIRPGYGQVVWMCNWAGGVKLIDGRVLEPDSCCGRAVGQLSILWDGTVTLCCYDPLAKHNLGDLKEQTIREVYNGEWYTQFREDHAHDRASKYEICRNCTRV